MSQSLKVHLRPAVFALMLLTLLECGRREPRDSPGTSDSPTQPADQQIGKNDSTMNACSRAVSDWVAMWREALPGFEVDSMWASGKGRWAPVGILEGEGFPEARGPNDVTFDLLALPSPGGRHVLYVDRYQAIMTEADTLEVGGEPDSQPALEDLQSHRVALLQFCGTPCGFHWGTWVSTTSFALGGWQDADAESRWKRGTLSIFSVQDSTVSTYVTRIVPSADYERYVSAWRGWLLHRYRALASAHPST